MAGKSRKQTLEEWEQLLTFVEENAARLPGVQSHRDQLERMYLKARLTKQLRDVLTEALADGTHRLRAAFSEGAVPAGCLRAVIREKLGISACEIPSRLRRKPPVDG